MSTDAPVTFDEDRWMKLKPKALGWLIGLVAIIVASWLTIKFDVHSTQKTVELHSVQLDQISVQLNAIKDDARAAKEASAEIRRVGNETALKAEYRQNLIEQKLDQVLAEKRGRTP